MKILITIFVCMLILGLVETTKVSENTGIAIHLFKLTITIKNREKHHLVFSERNKINCVYIGKYCIGIIKPKKR